MTDLKNDGQERDGAAPVPPQARGAEPTTFISFNALLAAIPLSERTLREEIRRGRIPTIRLPGGRRLLFHLPSVTAALLRHQHGGDA